MDIWWLWCGGPKDNSLTFKLDYFQDHFDGRPLAESWTPPQGVELMFKTKKVTDFVRWFLAAPVMSERARDVLEPLVRGHAEMLPLVQLKGRQYYAMNVLTTVDCLDRERSNILYSKERPDRILEIWEHVFDPARTQDVPVFKIPELCTSVFVTRPFAELVVQNGLVGAKFADPSENPVRKIMRRESLNVFPGAKS